MEPATRKERLCVLSAYLTANPNQLYPLSYFSELFGAAKSTLSEDISIMRSAFSRRGIGEIEVMMGASGGVRFLPAMPAEEMRRALAEIAQKLESPARILPGGFLYTADIFLSPVYVEKMARVLWNFFKNTSPDFIITVETKGIPLAMNVARFFGKPVVVARKESKLTEGSVVTINYLSGSSKRMQTMSLSKRAVREGQKALVIDDFLAGGGTVRAICEMMKEFGIIVVGCGVAIATREPEVKRIEHYKSLMVLEQIEEEQQKLRISVNLA
ncbi:pur operon repressor [Christensenellaceae bacterium 44-20]